MSLLRRRGPSLRERWRVELGDYASALALDGGVGFVGTGEGDVVPFAIASGAVGPALVSHRHGVMALVARGGVLASAGGDGRVVVGRPATRDGADAAWMREISASVPTSEGLAFAPDASRLAIADRRRVLVVDAAGEICHVLEPHPSSIQALAYAPDGRALAVAAYGGIRLWSLDAGEPSVRDLSWKGSLLQTAWRPNGSVIASGTQDGAVHFWRLDQGSDAEMHGFPSKPRSLVWDSRGRLLATSGGGLVCTWDFTTGPEGKRPTVLSGHDDSPCDVMAFLMAPSPDGAVAGPRAPTAQRAFKPLAGTLAGGSRGGRVLLWSPTRSSDPVASAEVGAEVTGLGWSASELLIVATAAGSVVAFEVVAR